MTAIADFLINPSLDRARGYEPELQTIQSHAAANDAYQAISKWRGYKPTPLILSLLDTKQLSRRRNCGQPSHGDATHKTSTHQRKTGRGQC